jgi:ribosomal protein L7/L12
MAGRRGYAVTLLVMEILVMAVILLVILNWISASGHRRTQQHALDKLQIKLDLVMAQLGVVVPEPEGIADVDALIRADRKIEAVKRYRELTGDGLLEAKTAVDRREQNLR